MTFDFMFVHISFSSVRVTEWPLFGKELPTRLTICSLCILIICNFSYFPFWFGVRGGSVDLRTPEREVQGSNPTTAVKCPRVRHLKVPIVLVSTQEAVAQSQND